MVAWRTGRKPLTWARGAGGITVEIFDAGAQGASQVGTLCSGPSMSAGGTSDTRRARDGMLPAGYRPPGGGKGTPAASDAPADGAPSPPIPADQAAFGQMQVVESLEAAVEALQRRLTAQEQTNESLARATDKLVDDVEALRKVDSHEEERRVAKSRRQSGYKTKNVKKTRKVTEDKSVRNDDPANAAPFSSPMILPLGRARRRQTKTPPTRRTRPLRTTATGRQARLRPQVGPRRATAQASRTQPRASAPLPPPPPNGRSDLKKPIGSK